jgi:hypothetical protein
MEKKNLAAIFAILVSLPALASPVFADTMQSTYPHFIWGNFPAMYLIDIAILVFAGFAVYFGSRLLAGKLKSSFNYVFLGVLLIALNYLIDFAVMTIGDMELMDFVHLDIFWIINGAAFVLLAVGFYRMNKVFKKVAGG